MPSPIKHDFVSLFDPKIFADLRQKYSKSLEESLKDSCSLDKVYNLDVVDFLGLVPTGSVNLMIVDEDYSAQPTAWNPAARDENVSQFDWKVEEVPTHAILPWAYHATRILDANHGNLVVFGFPQWATLFEAVAQDAGLTWRTHRVWVKTNSAPHRRPNSPNFASHFECIWICSLGKYFINNQEPRVMSNWVYGTVCTWCKAMYPVYLSREWDHPAWFKTVTEWETSDEEIPVFNGMPFMESICPRCNRVHPIWRSDQIDIDWYLRSFYASPLTNDPGREHKTKKPLWLYQELLTILSNPDDVIVDPMCGQGTAGVAAAALGRKYILNDLDPKWAKFSERTIKIMGG